MAVNHNPVHILVIGGTGQCGEVFVPRALEAGETLWDTDPINRTIHAGESVL